MYSIAPCYNIHDNQLVYLELVHLKDVPKKKKKKPLKWITMDDF